MAKVKRGQVRLSWKLSKNDFFVYHIEVGGAQPRRAAVAAPTDAAERWLQDTVPQAANASGDSRGSITQGHPPSGPLTPPLPSQNKHRYISHSLAPPPDDSLTPRPPHPHHPRSAPANVP